MPGLDGLAKLRRLANLKSHAPVIVMTGHADSQLASEALANGAADFIEKPFDHEDLIGRIDDVTGAVGPRRVQVCAPCRPQYESCWRLVEGQTTGRPRSEDLKSRCDCAS